MAVDCKGVFVGAYGSDVVAEQVTEFENMETQLGNGIVERCSIAATSNRRLV